MANNALPPKPAGVIFRVRIDGRVSRLVFKRIEAEWFAQDKAASGYPVEIIDAVTQEVVKRF